MVINTNSKPNSLEYKRNMMSNFFINTKRKLLYTSIRLVVFLFSIIFYSCKGQENKLVIEEPENKLSDSIINKTTNDITSQNTFPFLNNDIQISNVVRKVFQDSKENIWFGTENGAFVYNGEELLQIESIKSEIGKGVTIKDITEDKSGNIWFGHTDGISRFDGNKVKNYYKSNGLITNDVWCIEADKKGNVWIGTSEGACIFDGENFTPFKLPEGKIDKDFAISTTKMIHKIFEDSKGKLWFCTNAGLYSYANQKLENETHKLGIKTNFVNGIYESKNGTFWISTKEGLYRLKEQSLDNITKDKIIIGKGIGSVSEDKDGKVWLVSNQHDLYVYDNIKLTEIKKDENNKRPVVFQIYKDQTNRLWFVGFGGAYRFENDKFINITKNGPWD